MSLKVLICDADWRFAERATRFLGGHGHQVLTETLPTEATDLARRWKPDVVIIAAELTEDADQAILTELRLMTPRPAVLLTGQLDRFDAAWRAWQRGADELLLKPVIHGWELHTAIIAALRHVEEPAIRQQAIAG